MAWVAAALAAGIGIRWALPAPGWFLLTAAAAATAAGWARVRLRKGPRAANALVLAGVALWGIGRADLDLKAPADGIARWIGAEPRPVSLGATLVSPLELAQNGRTQRGWIRAEEVWAGEGWRPVSGRLELRLPSQAGPLEVGDRLRVHGLLRAGREGEFNERHWLWIHGTEGVFSVADAEGMTRLRARAGPWMRYRRWVARFHSRLSRLGRDRMGPEEAGCLEALLLGDRRGIPREIWEAYRKTGTVHVLVVSGLHVGLIGAFALTAMTLLRLPRWLCTLGLAGALLTYCLLTGADPPIVRATVMGLLFCLARWKGEEGSFVNGLGAAAAGMMALHPRVLANPGAQLSFAAVGGILAADSFVLRLSSARTITRRVARPLAASCGAWLATAPILAWHFHTFNVAAPLLNLLVVPWASGLIACGVLTYAAGWLSPPVAAPFAAAFGLLAGALNRLVLWVGGMPGLTLEW